MGNKEKPVERTFPIKVYLEKTDHKESIKKMMITLYPEVSKTMDEWKIEDDKINKGRC